MQVKKNTLLLLACLVWTAAGSTSSASACWPMPPKSLSPHLALLLVFFLFQVFVFGRLVGKHTDGSWDIGRTDSSSSAFLTRSPFSSWPG